MPYLARKCCLDSCSTKSMQSWVKGCGKMGGRSPHRLQGQKFAWDPPRSWEKSLTTAVWMEQQHLVRSQKGHGRREGSSSGHGIPLLSCSRCSGQAPPAPSHRVLEFQRSEASVGVGPGTDDGAQGLSRRRVPGHLSHRKGTRRRVKVAVKV